MSFLAVDLDFLGVVAPHTVIKLIDVISVGESESVPVSDFKRNLYGNIAFLHGRQYMYDRMPAVYSI